MGICSTLVLETSTLAFQLIWQAYSCYYFGSETKALMVFNVPVLNSYFNIVEAAIAQASTYLHEFHQHHQRPARAVAYDGLTLAFLEDDETVVRRGPASTLANVLESWLIGLGSDVITPDDFVARLGPASPRAAEVVDVLWRLFQAQRQQNRFIEEVFQVWRGLQISDVIRELLMTGYAEQAKEAVESSNT